MIKLCGLQTFCCLIIGIFASSLWGEVLRVSPDSKISFTAVGKPGFIRINGEGKDPKGEFTYENSSISGVVSFPLNSVSTGIDMRDTHLKEKYLDLAKFPEAKLIVSNLKFTSIADKSLSWTGVLSLHGKEKEVSGEAEVSCANFDPCEVKTSFPVILEDFAIDIPTYAGITVAKKVDIEVQLKLKKDTVAEKKDKS